MLVTTLCDAQRTVYTSGTRFTTAYVDLQMFLGVNAINDSSVFTSIHIAGANAGCAKIEIPYLNYNQSFWVEKDSIITVKLPLSPYTPLETVNQLGIAITCSSPMIVMQSNLKGKGEDSFDQNSPIIDFNTASSLIPDHILLQSSNRIPFSAFEGSRKVHINAPWFTSVGDFPYKIVSAVNNNIVQTISQVGSGGGGSIPPNTPYSINLNRLDEFSFLSGSTRTSHKRPYSFLFFYGQSDKPYKVIRTSNNMAVFDHTIPKGITYEDMKLHTYADTSFYTPPLAGNYGNQYSVMALHDSTILYFNGQYGLKLDSLEILDTCIVGEMNIASSNPVLGYLTPCPDRYTNSNWNSPFSVAMSSTNELINESLFLTFDEPDSLNHYILSVVTKTAEITNFKLDGSVLSSSSFTPFANNPAWSWANIEIGRGSHKVSSSAGFHAFHYTYYIHPDHPNEPTDFIFPSYGYTLGESVIVPEDSLRFKVGTTPSNLQPFGAFNTILCLGDPIYVQAGLQQNITWKYQIGDDTVLFQKVKDQRSDTIMHTFQIPGEYWLVVSDSAGCHPSDSVLIKVEDGLVADFDYQVENSCDGHLVSLQTEGIADSYMWTWPGGSSTESNPAFEYSGHHDDLLVSLTVTKNSCKDSSSMYLTIDSTSKTYIIPNVFTPNGDGINDEFCIENVTGYSECFQLNIFNRWGAEVFSSSNPDLCWPADNIASGVYFYILKIGTQEIKGNLTLSR